MDSRTLGQMDKQEVIINIPGPLITFKSAAWGAGQKELYLASQQAIRAAVQQSRDVSLLREWLTMRVKLSIDVEFHLKTQRVLNTDLDSMLGDLFNPLVEGACGPRPAQKPIPQVKDSLFWECHATKKSCPESEERTIIKITPLNKEAVP
jgi:hypothetical protein